MPKKVDLDKFLKGAEGAAAARRKRCRTCQHKEAAELIRRFMEKRRAGETRVSFSYFHSHCLSVLDDYAISVGATCKHVVNCLRVDPVTGEALR